VILEHHPNRFLGNLVPSRPAVKGPGVPKEIREKIFTPFFTTKLRGVGTGLGLGIVSRIVYDHGGTVTVDEASGGGALFAQLPLRPK